ncbi:MAG: response regulator [Acidobacteriota bacterium]|nr:response regulator [Acidobacteriota bacterium]
MEVYLYKNKVIAALKQQHPRFGDLVIAMMIRNRQQFIAEMTELIPELNSQWRLNLMGAMIEDGGVDLIPLFITAILKEGNVLFAKSLLLCYAHFDHYKALESLREIQPKLNHNLESVFQRVVAKFNGKFKEHFYMKEFQDGVANPKRLKHAVGKMIEEPNVLYVPFLNRMILEPNMVYREPGVSVLSELGDDTSVEPLLTLLTRYLDEQAKSKALAAFLLNKEMLRVTRLTDYLTALGRIAGWEETLPGQLAAEVLEKKLSTTLAWIQHSFGPIHPILWLDMEKFLKHFLSKGSVVEEQVLRLELAFRSDEDAGGRVINTITKTIGKIGRRQNMPQLTVRVEAAVPEDHPKRDSYLVSMLAGYQSPKALEKLLGLLAECDDPKVLLEIVTALDAFKLETVPDKLYILAADPDHRDLRRKAMELIAVNGPDPAKMATLLDHEKSAVFTDAVEMIAEHGLESGYALLLERLKPDKPLPFQQAVIEALAAFPRNHTGEAVYPFYLLPHGYDIRFAALCTLIKAGGAKRMSLIFKGLATYEEKKVPEMMTSILRQLETLPQDQIPPDVVDLPDRWAGVLNSPNEKFRLAALTILEKADWDRVTEHATWIGALAEALKGDLQRHVIEQRRIKGLILKIRSRQMTGRDQARENKTRDKIVDLMDHLEAGSHYEKLEALRKLNISYKPELLDDKNNERLVHLVDVFFNESEGDIAGLKPAVSVAAKVHHPKLMERIAQLQNHDDGDLARFARAAMGMLKKETEHTEIKSIFIMEEKIFMAKVLLRLLSKAGYEVAAEADADAALKEMTRKPYDLLIVGYQLADGSGIDFLRSTRREHVKPPRVIFLTGQKDEAAHREMMAAGAGAVMVKPFSNDALFALIKDLEHRRRIPAAV